GPPPRTTRVLRWARRRSAGSCVRSRTRIPLRPFCRNRCATTTRGRCRSRAPELENRCSGAPPRASEQRSVAVFADGVEAERLGTHGRGRHHGSEGGDRGFAGVVANRLGRAPQIHRLETL